MCTAPPKDRSARGRMRPLLAPELDEVVASIAAVSPVYADIMRVCAHRLAVGLGAGDAGPRLL